MHFNLTNVPVNSFRFLLLSMMVKPTWKMREPLEGLIRRMSTSGQRIVMHLKRARMAMRKAGEPEINSLYEILACQGGVGANIDDFTLNAITDWLRSLDPEFEFGSTFSPKLLEAISLAQEGIRLTPFWWQEPDVDIRDWHPPSINEIQMVCQRLEQAEDNKLMQKLDGGLFDNRSDRDLIQLRTSMFVAQQFLTMHDAENGLIR